MERTKHKFPFFFFFRRNSFQQLTPQQPVPHLVLKEFTMVITISGNHSYWAMYRWKVAYVLLGTCRLEILNPGSIPLLKSLQLYQ